MAAFNTFVSIWAVLIATVVYFVIGAIWYSLLFGKIWTKEMGFTKKDIDKAKKKGMAKSYVFNFIATFISIYILAIIIDLAEAFSVAKGAYAGFLVWLGFYVTTGIGRILWGNKSINLFLINEGYSLVGLVVSGILLAIL